MTLQSSRVLQPSSALTLVGVLWCAACGRSDSAVTDSATAPPPPAGTAAPTADTSTYVYVTDYGIGDLRAGMTYDDAVRVTPGLRRIAGTDSTECSYLEWPAAPPGVLVMFDEGHIARIDVDSAGTRTAAGAQVGDKASRIDSLYQGRVSAMPHKYTDGQYLVVTPPRVADSLYRLVFEVEKGVVTRYRVGLKPQVEYVEGCS